ncbi:isochorismate synthase [Pseudomonas chlororaphis]|uniref:isochorismate synthase n=1 Tax=Pseudomonas chlororaphis TaxID=587753 RepID=A0A0D5XZS4_9PSED|nr:isochorismate synthase [Pseudomonas chlororaphis]AKA24232.1 isochorismate synthase [Pseudomonas chlororaphis]
MSAFSQLAEHAPGLTRVFEQARQRAAGQGAPVLASYALAIGALDLLELFCKADQPHAESLFWRAADGGRSLFGWGVAAQLDGVGEQRFATVDRQWQHWLRSAVIHGPQPPAICGGFRFDPQVAPSETWQGFGDGSMLLMTLLLIRDGEQCWLVCQQRIAASDDPAGRCEHVLEQWNALMDRYLSPAASTAAPRHTGDHCLPRAAWEDKVAHALHVLRDSALNKVVLARQVRSEFSHAVNPGRTLARLAGNDPAAYLFAFRRQRACFIGASPERLAKLHDGHLQTLALAGTCRRDADPQRDAELARELLDCAKNRHEHAVVVQIIQSDLAPWVEHLQVPPTPAIQRLSRVQHLSTVIEGRLRPRASLLQVVATLHPTPAVGGHERQQAMAHIRQFEGFDRGWYAAPLGWLDARGNGEFIVGLRSALLDDRQACLFAGCGIVQCSDPASEYEETCIKLAGMQVALQA